MIHRIHSMRNKMRDIEKKNGILYGVSTGPGDPELMTIKAMRCIENCQVIAAPRTKGKNCMALDIVKGIMDIEDKEMLYLDFAMQKNEKVLESTHRKQADMIEEYLAAGKDVAMLNIGDASLYGTFCYVRELVEADGYGTKTVAGVTSFCAVAAELGQSLTRMDEPLTIIPGSYEYVEQMLEQDGTKVIMKSGNALSEVKRILEEKGMSDRSAMVANCGLHNQRIYKDIKKSEDDEGYFVTILIK